MEVHPQVPPSPNHVQTPAARVALKVVRFACELEFRVSANNLGSDRTVPLDFFGYPPGICSIAMENHCFMKNHLNKNCSWRNRFFNVTP